VQDQKFSWFLLTEKGKRMRKAGYSCKPKNRKQSKTNRP